MGRGRAARRPPIHGTGAGTRGATMTERSDIDPAEREELERRASVHPEEGAIRGDVPEKPQPDAWEAAKIDLAADDELRRERERRGDPPATAADEAFHGAVAAHTPEEFTGLRTARVKRTAAGLPAVRVALGYALDEMGAVDEIGRAHV